jgi:hypothetical protein
MGKHALLSSGSGNALGNGLEGEYRSLGGGFDLSGRFFVVLAFLEFLEISSSNSLCRFSLSSRAVFKSSRCVLGFILPPPSEEPDSHRRLH